MENKIVMTRSGRIKMQEELDNLKGPERRRLLELLSEARDKGDISENAEYEVAKADIEMLTDKINRMETIISNSVIIDSSNIDTSLVSVLTTVRVKNKKSNQEMKFTIVPENETDMKLGKISLNSPIGKGLIGRKVNESVKIEVPAGIMEFKILEITL
jgi:transcription elongation factor GreA